MGDMMETIIKDLNDLQIKYNKGEFDLNTLINRVYNYGYGTGRSDEHREAMEEINKNYQPKK